MGETRFGDHLLSYCKAKWFSEHFNVELVYQPFAYSNQLMLDDLEYHYNKKWHHRIRTKNVRHVSAVKLQSNTLYQCVLYTKITIEMMREEPFNRILRQHLSPKHPVPLMQLPHDRTCVAVHVRKGGGFDPPLLSEEWRSSSDDTPSGQYADKMWPPKFPPEKYYIDQIKYVYDYYNKEDLYIYIFTDDPEPQAITQRFKEAVNAENIQFDCRKENQDFTNTMMQDFYNMAQFDCLIRPDSTFSICIQLIGDHDLVIAPDQFHWEGNTLNIDTVTFYKRS